MGVGVSVGMLWVCGTASGVYGGGGVNVCDGVCGGCGGGCVEVHAHVCMLSW